MENSQRFRFPKTVVFGISLAYIIVILITCFYYYQEPTIACAQRLLSMQLVALVFQAILNYFNYRSQKKIVILATLFISSMILMGVLSAFFNFGIICEVYPMQ